MGIVFVYYTVFVVLYNIFCMVYCYVLDEICILSEVGGVCGLGVN